MNLNTLWAELFVIRTRVWICYLGNYIPWTESEMLNFIRLIKIISNPILNSEMIVTKLKYNFCILKMNSHIYFSSHHSVRVLQFNFSTQIKFLGSYIQYSILSCSEAHMKLLDVRLHVKQATAILYVNV